jgi:hypothetical protein
MTTRQSKKKGFLRDTFGEISRGGKKKRDLGDSAQFMARGFGN